MLLLLFFTSRCTVCYFLPEDHDGNCNGEKNVENKTCHYHNRDSVENVCEGHRVVHNYLRSEEKAKIVDTHNDLRNNLTLGFYKRIPKARFLKKLSWNENLAELAQNRSIECEKYEREKKKNDNYHLDKGDSIGENVAIVNDNDDNSVDDLMKLWINGLNYLNYDLISRYRPPSIENEYDFSTVVQTIWWNTSEIGCGRSKYNRSLECDDDDDDNDDCLKNETVIKLICYYFPMGNKINESVYIIDKGLSLLCHYENSQMFCAEFNGTDDDEGIVRVNMTGKSSNRSRQKDENVKFFDLTPVDSNGSPIKNNFYVFYLLLLTFSWSIC